ncbi:hypothetical protein E2C01_083081 [Portunus trituberculatus]|uniref:Uncharacterized protein n=1 Tax=Portunus trituberculatus TaxID=210409 RepID=A0A5B7J6U3_PORTR|nr:hypothetical protein [Portunus trituberculatus]
MEGGCAWLGWSGSNSNDFTGIFNSILPRPYRLTALPSQYSWPGRDVNQGSDMRFAFTDSYPLTVTSHSHTGR